MQFKNSSYKDELVKLNAGGAIIFRQTMGITIVMVVDSYVNAITKYQPKLTLFAFIFVQSPGPLIRSHN